MDYIEARRARRQEIMTAHVVVGVLLSLTAGAASAADLDRLFFTPEQRATLDKARKQNSRSEADREFKPPAAPLPQNVSVTGMIRRSDGKNTIWLNNRVVNERQAGGIIAGAGKRDNQVRLSLPDAGKSVDLKVGQTLEILSGTIEENYLRRRAPESASGSGAANENRAAEASKVTPAQPLEPVKSETLAQKRAARAAERNAADDARFNSDSEPR
jgi:hypothetical protein